MHLIFGGYANPRNAQQPLTAHWRALQAIADPEGEDTDLQALGKRVGYGVSALVYAGLALCTAS